MFAKNLKLCALLQHHEPFTATMLSSLSDTLRHTQCDALPPAACDVFEEVTALDGVAFGVFDNMFAAPALIGGHCVRGDQFGA